MVPRSRLSEFWYLWLGPLLLIAALSAAIGWAVTR